MIFEDFKDRLVNMGYSYSTYELPSGKEYIFELPKAPGKNVNFFFCRYKEDTDYMEYYPLYDNVDSGRVGYLADMGEDWFDFAASVHQESYKIYVIKQKEKKSNTKNLKLKRTL